MGKFTLPKDGGLIEKNLPNGVKHTFEHIPTHIFEDEIMASERLAEKIAAAISGADGIYRLGLSTGTSLSILFKALVRRHKEEGLSFRNVEIYSTDEFYPAPSDSFSRNRRLYEDLIAQVDIAPENVFIPKITEIRDSASVSAFCAEYDEKARGLDLLVMGIGDKGEVGFNEFSASDNSRTRTVLLPYANVRLRYLPETSQKRRTKPLLWVFPQ